ncbi:MAG: patatin-like phospholipase family protein [Proteobacteria bacterium]|nr:patatin-like phospholipase family protein [Pseudomonadota bacterium]
MDAAAPHSSPRRPTAEIIARAAADPAPARSPRPPRRRLPFERVALLLQGGGALGAYQGGVYEALSEAALEPDWVAGISIGAINAALIAGNAPDARVARLREFWERITPVMPSDSLAQLGPMSWMRGDLARGLRNQFSAAAAIVGGVRGFFEPRVPAAWFQAPGSLEATSYYDTAGLRSTLERLIDFDRINSGDMRFSVGAVNVTSGNFVYFDNTTHVIRPEHVMASGALPPALPAIEIDGEFYWDGGLVSNTPLQWVLETEPQRDTLAFQVDLWNARGAFPRSMAEVMTRQKEIQFSSRTRTNSDRFRHMQMLRNTLASLLEKLPEELRDSPEIEVLAPVASAKAYNIVQLIYRAKGHEGDSKDYEFSRLSMEEHWRAGAQDTVRTLRHAEILERPANLEGVLTFDLGQNGRE